MRLVPAILDVLLLSLFPLLTQSNQQLQVQQTRSLSGTPATDGNNVTNAEYFNLLTLHLLQGFTIWKVKMYNDRVYLERTRRSYWFGDRYYRLDNYYYLSTRDTCAYRMNETQRRNLQYEDGFPIYDIIYQCQRYVEYCCGLDCCLLEDLNKRQPRPRSMKSPWDNGCKSFRPLFAAAILFVFLKTLF